MKKSSDLVNIDNLNIRESVIRYASFWPYFLISSILCVLTAYLTLRYSTSIYQSTAKIEILDKAQDSEMALPTSMTIFNRSMVNLENEMGVLESFSLHKRVVDILRSNIKLYTKGKLKNTLEHNSTWFDNYSLVMKKDLSEFNGTSFYDIIINNSNLEITHLDNNEDFIESYSFNGLSTKSKINDLPFELTILQYDKKNNYEKRIEINNYIYTIQDLINSVNIIQSGSESDQLILNLNSPNSRIANEYLNTLISEFDKDGISDRQSEYKRTMDFVDTRSEVLGKELEKIELDKKNFKKLNNLTDIKFDANVNVSQKFNYNSELYKTQAQYDLAVFLEETIENDTLQLIPVNIGIENQSMLGLISDYNIALKERDRFLMSVGPNNNYIKNIEAQLTDYFANIKQSLENYKQTLKIKINSLELKEKEYVSFYNNIPENEKILRSINRQLEVKESLFLLLLQKREEAAINFAVIKPSIKVIDYSRSTFIPISPNARIIYLAALVISFLLPFSVLFLWFSFDNKIHTREQLSSVLSNIPIIGEIPFQSKLEPNSLLDSFINNMRLPLIESVRMVVANLNYTLFSETKDKNLILVTSSIKGEGKTVVSLTISKLISKKFDKVLLIGSDLRNPQIHKYLNLDKGVTGVSDYIYRDDLNWKDLIVKSENLDIILSGTIPPNPTDLLSSDKFNNFIKEAKKIYDYVIVDSAPCLLVSDTFEITKNVDSTIYVVRSNHTEINVVDFINELNDTNKLKNMFIVLNSVGHSHAYGYKYGYQYGYKYGYKYGYNYGYGYGYGQDKDD